MAKAKIKTNYYQFVDAQAKIICKPGVISYVGDNYRLNQRGKVNEFIIFDKETKTFTCYPRLFANMENILNKDCSDMLKKQTISKGQVVEILNRSFNLPSAFSIDDMINEATAPCEIVEVKELVDYTTMYQAAVASCMRVQEGTRISHLILEATGLWSSVFYAAIPDMKCFYVTKLGKNLGRFICYNNKYSYFVSDSSISEAINQFMKDTHPDYKQGWNERLQVPEGLSFTLAQYKNKYYFPVPHHDMFRPGYRIWRDEDVGRLSYTKSKDTKSKYIESTYAHSMWAEVK
jgi:hypothetical protein